MDAGAKGLVLKAEAGRILAEAVRAVLSGGEFFSERVLRAAGRDTVEGQMRLRHRKPALLTYREREVLQLLAETHRARIMAKLDVHSMSELVRYAIRNSIIQA